jgi:transposase InsO family protein
MDFIEGLPTSSHYNCILVVVDKFSKYAHFIKLKHPFSALQVAQSFMEIVYKLHGMLTTIVSDRDKVFTSLLWKELFKLASTKLCMSSAYHPQSDGQTERVNQCIEGYLKCFIHSYPTAWSQWLHLAEYWYNTCYHSALKLTPFEVMYAQTPRRIDPNQDVIVPELDTWI